MEFWGLIVVDIYKWGDDFFFCYLGLNVLFFKYYRLLLFINNC